MHSDPIPDSELRWGEMTLRQRNRTLIQHRNYSPTSAGSQRHRSTSQRTLLSAWCCHTRKAWFSLIHSWQNSGLWEGINKPNLTWDRYNMLTSPSPFSSWKLETIQPLTSTSQWKKDSEGLNKTNLTKGNSKDGNEKGHEVRTGTEAQKWNDTEGVTHSGAGPSSATQIWQWSTNPMKLGQHR